MRFLVLFLIVSYDSSLLTLPVVVCSVSVFAHRRRIVGEKRPTKDAKGTHENDERRRLVVHKLRRKSIKDDDGRSDACVFIAREEIYNIIRRISSKLSIKLSLTCLCRNIF